MRKRNPNQLNCFSPPIMLATFTIETILGAYTIWRYKLNVLGRLVLSSLLALALFQLCEYHVCGGLGLRAEEWARLGFVAITLLPALGLHMLYVLAGKSERRVVWAAYATMTIICVYFSVSPGAFDGFACTGNYDIFQIGSWQSAIYGLYYYGWLLTAIVKAMRWADDLMDAKTPSGHKRLSVVRGLIVGYLVFLVPTAIANTVKPETRRGIPSIMCGFAILFAFILVCYIMPKMGAKRRTLDDRGNTPAVKR
jgi:hypothetical protein